VDTESYILSVDRDGQAKINEAIGNLIGETVLVSYTTTQIDTPYGRYGERENFDPQISVQAKLEGSKETGKYRVLIDDDSYSYFYATSIWSMGKDVGKRAVVFIS
jgi:hypothetical protein